MLVTHVSPTHHKFTNPLHVVNSFRLASINLDHLRRDCRESVPLPIMATFTVHILFFCGPPSPGRHATVESTHEVPESVILRADDSFDWKGIAEFVSRHFDAELASKAVRVAFTQQCIGRRPGSCTKTPTVINFTTRSVIIFFPASFCELQQLTIIRKNYIPGRRILVIGSHTIATCANRTCKSWGTAFEAYMEMGERKRWQLVGDDFMQMFEKLSLPRDHPEALRHARLASLDRISLNFASIVDETNKQALATGRLCSPLPPLPGLTTKVRKASQIALTSAQRAKQMNGEEDATTDSEMCEGDDEVVKR